MYLSYPVDAHSDPDELISPVSFPAYRDGPEWARQRNIIQKLMMHPTAATRYLHWQVPVAEEFADYLGAKRNSAGVVESLYEDLFKYTMECKCIYCTRVCVCVCVRVRACVCVCVCVFGVGLLHEGIPVKVFFEQIIQNALKLYAVFCTY